MPPITSNKEELDGLHTLVDSSVVVLIRSKDGTDVDFATGFVIFVNRSMALICVDRYLIKNDESLAVRFHDNTRQTAHVFFQKSISRHAILEVRSDTCRHLRPVTFSESEMTRQDLFTVAAVHKEGRLGLMTGTVGNPSCEAITLRGDPIYRSEGTFAFTCPVPGRSRIPNVREMHWEEPEELGRIIGAAVFDMHGLVIGTVVTTDPCSDGTKFAIKSSFFLDQLESNLKLKDKKISLLRHGRGLGQGSRMSRHHDTTAEAASRKRGRANIPRGGTGTGKSVRLTHLEGTVEVVCKKQPRLHKHPVQGDMDGVRRKAVQGDMDGVRRKSFEQALMRLVTLESDDARRSSSCPSDATIKSKKCMKVFIARNPGDVGSDNSIAVEPFDLNQFFCGDDKHYDNTLKNGTADQVEKIIKILNEGQIASTDVIEVVVSSPYVFLPTVKDKLRPENQVAAKNCCVKKGGAFSGEVSAEMLANLGIHWVILGHFERRSLFGESSEFVGDKVASALSQGLEVIACVGETLEQRGAGSTMAVVVEQTKAIAEKIKDWTNVVIAYEPVWAIGTGKVATPAHAQEVHANLRDWLKTNVSPEVAKSTKIVYAGSVIGANANELASQPDIDGFLVSGASLKLLPFMQRIRWGPRINNFLDRRRQC